MAGEGTAGAGAPQVRMHIADTAGIALAAALAAADVGDSQAVDLVTAVGIGSNARAICPPFASMGGVQAALLARSGVSCLFSRRSCPCRSNRQIRAGHEGIAHGVRKESDRLAHVFHAAQLRTIAAEAASSAVDQQDGYLRVIHFRFPSHHRGFRCSDHLRPGRSRIAARRHAFGDFVRLEPGVDAVALFGCGPVCGRSAAGPQFRGRSGMELEIRPARHLRGVCHRLSRVGLKPELPAAPAFRSGRRGGKPVFRSSPPYGRKRMKERRRRHTPAERLGRAGSGLGAGRRSSRIQASRPASATSSASIRKIAP